MSSAFPISGLIAFALPLLLLWAAHSGFRLGRLGRAGERRPVRIRFRLRHLLLFTTLVAILFAIAQPPGPAKLVALIAVVMSLAWLGLVAVAFVNLCTREPADRFEDQ